MSRYSWRKSTNTDANKSTNPTHESTNTDANAPARYSWRNWFGLGGEGRGDAGAVWGVALLMCSLALFAGSLRVYRYRRLASTEVHVRVVPEC